MSMRACCHLVSRRRASRIETRASKQACDDVVPSTGHRTWRRVGDASPARTLRKSQRVAGRRGVVRRLVSRRVLGQRGSRGRRGLSAGRRRMPTGAGRRTSFMNPRLSCMDRPPRHPPNCIVFRILFFSTPRTQSMFPVEVREFKPAQIFEKLPLLGSVRAVTGPPMPPRSSSRGKSP